MIRSMMSSMLMCLALVGCASGGARPNGDSPFSSTDRPDSIRIEVLNLNFQEARLYALRDSERVSLGIVGGKQEGSFTIPWNLSQDLRIEINLLAGPTCTTESLPVQPGDILELQINSVFSQSSFCRRFTD